MALTPIAVATLALLAERPMHPYEMVQTLLDRHEDRVVKVRPGSLYHAVERLAVAGMAEVVGTDRGGNRPERTTYRITDAGRETLTRRLREMLGAPAAPYPELVLGLAEAHNLPRADVVTAVGRHLAALRADTDELAGLLDAARAAGVAETYWIDGDYLLHLRRAEITWLDTLLARLTDGDLPWPK
ncbi:MAG TPA: PadR family transcriptional regulator [Nocardioides sp.]